MKSKKLRSKFLPTALKIWVIALLSVGFSACQRNNPDWVPAYPVDVFISLDDPSFLKLKNFGGAATVQPSYGGRGIVIYRNGPESFSAVERTCSYRYTDSCARVNISSDEIWLECPCCGSRFTFDGQVLNAPANLPLRTYQTSYSPTNNTLRIYQ
jgi:nitrite reductase/ring-hydroxylating ferredoxin subunit